MLEKLEHYKILDWIGVGGIGEVCRARDVRHGRTVAIKMPGRHLIDDAGRRDEFLRDARAAAALSHPNIATLYDIGEDGDDLFLVYEFVTGESLKTAIAGRPLNVRRAIDLAIQVADAAAEAHAAGIVHRDLKPGNIVVTPKGHVKILDFGFSRWTNGGVERSRVAGSTALEPHGLAMEAVTYMSPEQVRNESEDHRTDVFSLGIVLFEMLTGQPPFAGPTIADVARQIVETSPRAPSEMNSSVPRELDGIVARSLAVSPNDRYDAMATLAAELREVAVKLDKRAATPEASRAVRVPPPRQMKTTNKGWIVAALLAALAAVAYFFFASR
jgi:serine/threonine-protein kinase